MENLVRTRYIVNVGENNKSQGYVYFDDGVSSNQTEKDFVLFSITYENMMINFTVTGGNATYKVVGQMTNIVEKVIIPGASNFANVTTACYFGPGEKPIPVTVTADYNKFVNILTLTLLTDVAINDIAYIKIATEATAD